MVGRVCIYALLVCTGPIGSETDSMQRFSSCNWIGVVFLAAVSSTATAQSGTLVSGTITSATTNDKLWGCDGAGERYPDANRDRPTRRFGLVAPSDAVLTVAMIGYRSQRRALERPEHNRRGVGAGAPMLEEVVVTVDHSKQRRSDINGAVSSVQTWRAPTGRPRPACCNALTAASPASPSQQRLTGSRTTLRIRGVSSFPRQ